MIGALIEAEEEILSKPDGLYRENNALMNRLLRRWLEHMHGPDWSSTIHG